MIPYDYLFFCSYKMGMRSNNFVGLPVLAGMMMVTPNMMIHLAILQIVLQTLEIAWFDDLIAQGVWGRILYLGFFLFVYWYYLFKGRYKRVIEKYNLRKVTYWKKHPFVTILLYTMTSFVVFFIVVCFKKVYIF